MFFDSSTLSGAVLSSNTASGGRGVGAGLLLADLAHQTVSGCTIDGNIASGGGAGIYVADDLPVIKNCTITNNNAGANGSGGGMLVEGIFTGAGFKVDGNVFAHNTAKQGAGINYSW